MPEVDYLRPSPIRFDDENYQTCYAYWLRLRGNRWAPAWREWDWNELPAALIPYFIVVDVKYDPIDFIYRFWGTANLDMLGVDMTGKSVADIRADVTKDQTIQQYLDTIESRQAMGTTTTIQIEPNLPLHDQTSLRLPMSRDGRNVDMIVSVADWQKHHVTIREEVSSRVQL